MRKRTRALALLLSGIMAVSVFPLLKPDAVEESQTSFWSKNIGSGGFPASYEEKLASLRAAHPNWTFRPLYTGLDFEEVVKSEYEDRHCLIWYKADDLLKSQAEGDYDPKTGNYVFKDSTRWFQTTKDLATYFIDPRNWINEENIFCFEDISYSSQTVSGVEAIISGSFMDGKTVEDSIEVKETKEDETSKKKSSSKKSNRATSESTEEVAASQSEEAVTSAVTEEVTEAETAVEAVTEGTLEEPAFQESLLKLSASKKKSSKKTESKGTSYAQVIYDAGVAAGISPYYLASKILQEVGRDGSDSVSGSHGGITGIYNFYNIGASDGADPISNGLNWASQEGDYGRPWTSPEKSIKGGASYIADHFLGNGQSTGYLLRFNVNPNGSLYSNQYMTNVTGAQQESIAVRNTYVASGQLEKAKTFLIPVYDNMPTLEEEIDTAGYTEDGIAKGAAVIYESPQTDSGVLTTVPKGGEVTIIRGVRNTDSYSFDRLSELYFYEVSYRADDQTYHGYIEIDQVYQPLTFSAIKGQTLDLAGQEGYYYQSENTGIASVSEDGILTLNSPGRTRIFIFNGISFQTIEVRCVKKTDANREIRSISLEKTALSIRNGETYQITTNTDVRYNSSKGSVAGVTKNGKIVARKYGMTVICLNHGSLLSTIKVTVQPEAVSDFAPYQMSYNQIRFKWTPTSDAKGYVIYRCKKGEDYELYATIKNPKKKYFADREVEEGTIYTYKMVAYGSNREGKVYSKATRVSAKAQTASPENLRVENTKQLNSHGPARHVAMILSWDQVRGADGYVIYRKTDDAEYKKVTTIYYNQVVSYADSRIEEGHTYCYKIKAYVKEKKMHYSEESQEVSIGMK